jgi:hypothetical protein
MQSSVKRRRGASKENMDVYQHFNVRDDVEKTSAMYSYKNVECRHCRDAFKETSEGIETHPVTRRFVSEPVIMRNIIPQMIRHISKCPFAQESIMAEEISAAKSQAKSRLSNNTSSSTSNTKHQPFYQPLLNAPLSAEQTLAFKQKILNFTIAAALPFSWVELPEAKAIFELIRKVLITLSI